MPPIEETDLPHTAVLWAALGVDEFGNPTVGEPVEIECRWVTTEGITTDARGNPMPMDAQVVVDREIPLGSNMWRGTLDGWGESPTTEIMYVVGRDETDDVKGRDTRHAVNLSRFRDAPAGG